MVPAMTALLLFFKAVPIGRWVEFALLAAVIGLATSAYVMQHNKIMSLKLEVANEKTGRSNDREAYANAAVAMLTANQAKTARILVTQSEAANAAQDQAQRADVAERAATRSSDGLRIAARTLAAGCGAVSSSPTAAASSAADRLADVLGESSERYRAVALAADRAIIRGQQCQVDYDALTPSPAAAP